LRLSSGELSASEREEFETWRKASIHHEVEYQWESLVWERTERLKALRPPDGEVDPLLLTSLVSGDRKPLSWGQKLRRIVRPAALAASLLLAAGVAWFFMQESGEPVVYETAVGERRSIDLGEGSRLELNTDTAVAVRFTRDERRIELLRGESLFDVQPDPRRPFLVMVGDRTVRAVGTAFNIRREPGATSVIVTEGVVEVIGHPRAGRSAFNVRLPAGSIAIDDEHGLVSREMAEGELERALSWRFGAIILAGETLAQAAAEFNRYNTRQLVVVDPAISGLRLGGYFNARDVDSFVDVLVSTYALDASSEGATVSLRGTDATESRVRESGISVQPM